MLRILFLFISSIGGLSLAHATASEDAFVKANPCPNGKNDCFYYRRVLNPNVQGAGRYRQVLIRAEVIREGVESSDLDVIYKSPDVERCRVRACRDNIPKSDLQLANSRVATLMNVATMGLYEVGVDYPNCSVCRNEKLSGDHIRIQLPAPVQSNQIPPYSLTAAQGYLNGISREYRRTDGPNAKEYRTECAGSRLLNASLPNLRAAQNAFFVPAATIACLIGQESKWNPSSISSTGYKGLPQTDQHTVDTLMNRLDRKSDAFDPELFCMWNAYMPNTSPSVINLNNMYSAHPEKLTQAQLQRMAKISIAFVGLSLRQQMNLRVSNARIRYGNQAAGKLQNTPTALAMAMVGYNAGQGNADDILPPAAYLGNNSRNPNYNDLSWSQHLLSKASSATVEQAEDYVQKIHACESSSAFTDPNRVRPTGFVGRCEQ